VASALGVCLTVGICPTGKVRWDFRAKSHVPQFSYNLISVLCAMWDLAVTSALVHTERSIVVYEDKKKLRKKRRVQLLMTLHLRATGCHLPYGITQCCPPPPDTSEHTPP